MADFNIWTSISDFFTKTVPAAVAGAPKGGIGPHVVPGPTPTSPPTFTDGAAKDSAPAFSLDLINELEEAAKSNPRELAVRFTEIYTALGVAMGVLSVIPGEANLGGPFAARIFHDLLRPIVSKVYVGPAELYLSQFFPTEPLNPRLIVSGVEAGAFSEDQLVELLTEQGVTDKGITGALLVARVKRFDVETKDDLALVKTYQQDLIKLQIALLQDSEKAIIADLKSRRASVAAELKGVLAAGG